MEELESGFIAQKVINSRAEKHSAGIWEHDNEFLKYVPDFLKHDGKFGKHGLGFGKHDNFLEHVFLSAGHDFSVSEYDFPCPDLGFLFWLFSIKALLLID